MKALRLCVAAALLVALAGCEEDKYEIAMRPEGKTLHRRLTCWREKTEKGATGIVGFPEDKLAALAAAYERPVPAAEQGKHSFEGRFTGRTPDDVGGSGSYTFFATSLGGLYAYLERFRGAPDLAGGLAFGACDRFADLLIGWFEAELGREQGFAGLHNFMNTRLRADMKNVAVYGWLHQAAEGLKAESGGEVLARLVEYVADQGYLAVEDVPLLVRAAADASADRGRGLLAHVRRVAAQKMGLDPAGPEPAALGFLADAESAAQSLSRFLAGTEEYRAVLKEWEENRKANPDAPRPEPGKVMEDLLGRMLGDVILAGSSGSLTIRFSMPRQPIYANGEWDQEAACTMWGPKPLRDKGFPSFAYAVWAVPDEAAQRRLFGAMLLDGEPLYEYGMWRKGLGEKEAAEWEGFLASLKPGQELRQRLEAFRFAGDPKPGAAGAKQVPSLADTPRRLLLAALEAQPQGDAWR